MPSKNRIKNVQPRGDSRMQETIRTLLSLVMIVTGCLLLIQLAPAQEISKSALKPKTTWEELAYTIQASVTERVKIATERGYDYQEFVGNWLDLHLYHIPGYQAQISGWQVINATDQYGNVEIKLVVCRKRDYKWIDIPTA
jgi:hypothetical protein